jgi:hypothetical protein
VRGEEEDQREGRAREAHRLQGGLVFGKQLSLRTLGWQFLFLPFGLFLFALLGRLRGGLCGSRGRFSCSDLSFSLWRRRLQSAGGEGGEGSDILVEFIGFNGPEDIVG